MTTDLRIPLTPAQKQTIDNAMAIGGREKAGWARAMLLEAAQAILDGQPVELARRNTKSSKAKKRKIE
jgi:hypothetical protein